MHKFRAKQVMLALFVMLLIISGLQYRSANWQVKQLDEIEQPEPGQRVLIVAPHCDDEGLAAGALVHRLVGQGVQVKVVVITNGDGFPRAAKENYLPKSPTKSDFTNLGYHRQQETERALALLGVNSQDIIFLGYPDAGLYSLWTPRYWNEPYTSQYTKVSQSPYLNSFTSAVSYTGANVVSDLRQVISEYRPDYVFYPHPNDSHADHWATYCFTKYALTELGMEAKEYLYLVHRGAWPLVLPLYGKTYLAPPRKLIDRGAEWSVLELTSAEMSLKRRAIGEYKTQMRVMEFTLLAFCRRNELFATYPDSQILRSSDPEPNLDEHLLALNPVGDLPLFKVQVSADLVSLSGCITTSDDLQLSLRARGRISKNMGYTYDMFFYRAGEEQSRLLVSWQQGKLKATLYQAKQESELKDISIAIDDRTLTAIIPAAYWSQADRVFLGCVSSQGNVRIDNLAWRAYRLPQP